MRARAWIIALVVVALASVGVFVFRSRQASKTGPDGKAAASASADRPVPVATVVATPRDVPIWLEGLGNVSAYATVTVRPQVDGRLDKVLFKEGQSVKAGDVIAEIDPRPFQIALMQQQGAMARDAALLKNAKLGLDRATRLKNEGVGSQQAVDDATAAVAQNEGLLALDAASVANARLNLDYATVRSPIEGVTGVRMVDVGNVVRASDPSSGLVVITQLDPIAVFFTLPEDDLPKISEEMAKGPLTVEVYARDGSSKLGTGTLGVVDNQINQATASVRLKAILPNPGKQLWPNQFVRARLSLSTRHDAILVPTTAVQRGPKGTFAYVIGPDGTAVMQDIALDVSLGEETIIARGIKPGQSVITEGQAQLRPGAKLDAKPAKTGGPWGMPSAGRGPRPAGSDSAGESAGGAASVPGAGAGDDKGKPMGSASGGRRRRDASP